MTINSTDQIEMQANLSPQKCVCIAHAFRFDRTCENPRRIGLLREFSTAEAARTSRRSRNYLELSRDQTPDDLRRDQARATDEHSDVLDPVTCGYKRSGSADNENQDYHGPRPQHPPPTDRQGWGDHTRHTSLAFLHGLSFQLFQWLVRPGSDQLRLADRTCVVSRSVWHTRERNCHTHVRVSRVRT
jgi:hypothetical protein